MNLTTCPTPPDPCTGHSSLASPVYLDQLHAVVIARGVMVFSDKIDKIFSFLLGKRRIRWTNVKPAWCQRLVFAGINMTTVSYPYTRNPGESMQNLVPEYCWVLDYRPLSTLCRFQTKNLIFFQNLNFKNAYYSFSSCSLKPNWGKQGSKCSGHINIYLQKTKRYFY